MALNNVVYPSSPATFSSRPAPPEDLEEHPHPLATQHTQFRRKYGHSWPLEGEIYVHFRCFLL